MEAIAKSMVQQGWGYANITKSPVIFGLSQCYSDLSKDDCLSCFAESRTKLPRCLPAIAARIYLDGCFLRYDNYSFFNESIDPNHDMVRCSEPSGVLKDNYTRSEFSKKVDEVINNVTKTAVQKQGFAVAGMKGGAVVAYALAQCWKTVDQKGCRDCLVNAESAVRRCLPGSEGRALNAGCYLRYSTEKFYNDGTAKKSGKGLSDTGMIIAFILSVLAVCLLAFLGAFVGYILLSKRKRNNNNALARIPTCINRSDLNFKYETLERATNFFDSSRKLGQGGAGSVFKGTLPDGRTVAVKRLFFNTRQWVDEFFNEVNLISRIQHKNLVGLLGCSIEGPESLLVYEYVPNKSVDQILFGKNPTSCKDGTQGLSWQQRFEIIVGTAEGLAYLHGGSEVKIIHRDIKGSNILLDENLNPKIADFGLARCVAPDKSHVSTGIAGTLGYMAPEYLVRGQLSEKADVYAYGVLILEIVCGRKNCIFVQGSDSVLQTVWKHYKSNSVVRSVDPSLKGDFPLNEARNVVQIGLLCTQASFALRPSMSQVVQMLTDQNSVIPEPMQPPFLNASVLDPSNSLKNSITRNLTPSFHTATEPPSTHSSNSSAMASQESYTPSAMDVSGPRGKFIFQLLDFYHHLVTLLFLSVSLFFVVLDMNVYLFLFATSSCVQPFV
uniref:Cysteine-rich receptor-like protein kinase 1 n=1 Tax=Vitis vinifera TaxID=29760 RepID=F6GSL9_VITVI